MSKASKIWRVGWRLAVCAILMGWIFHAIFMNEGKLAAQREGRDWAGLKRGEQWRQAWATGPVELGRSLRKVAPGAFALSLVFMGGTVVLGAYRWRMALRVHGLDLPYGRALEISLVAHFFNSFMLGNTGGDVMKAYYAARETHHKKAEAVAAVMVDRLIGLWSMLLFAGGLMALNAHTVLENDKVGATAAVVLAMLCGCTMVVLLAFWGGVSRRWAGARSLLRRLPKGDWVERLLDSCREFGRAHAFLLKALALSMVLNAVCVGQYISLGWGLNLQAPPMSLFLVVPMVTFISALPFTIGGLGVRENLFVTLLAIPAIVPPDGAHATTALSLSLLAYAGSLCWSLLGGLVYAMFRERHHLKDVGSEDEPAAA